MKHTIFGQFFANPLTTGAICASSPELSRLIVKMVGTEKASSIVELGPGTGAVTGFILEEKNPDSHFFVIELNPDILTAFRKSFPTVKAYQDCASNLPAILKQEGLASVDVVISGLPWASFPDDTQEEVLNSIYEALPKGGVFATFAYIQGAILPTGHSFKRRLNEYFSTVEKSEVVWRNIPPAFIYCCRK